jgi:hypothetical protein
MGELLRRELRRGEVEEEKGRSKDWSRGEGRRRAEQDSETLVSAISEIPNGVCSLEMGAGTGNAGWNTASAYSSCYSLGWMIRSIRWISR